MFGDLVGPERFDRVEQGGNFEKTRVFPLKSRVFFGDVKTSNFGGGDYSSAVARDLDCGKGSETTDAMVRSRGPACGFRGPRQTKIRTDRLP